MTRKKGADEIFCRSCGEPIKKAAALCPECGTPNTESSAQTANRTSASLTTAPEPASPEAHVADGGATASQTAEPRVPSVDRPSLDSVAPYVAWGSGIFLLLMGLSVLASDGGILLRLLSAMVFVGAGMFAIPPIRAQLEPTLHAFGIKLSRAAVIAILILGLFIGALLAP